MRRDFNKEQAKVILKQVTYCYQTKEEAKKEAEEAEKHDKAVQEVEEK